MIRLELDSLRVKLKIKNVLGAEKSKKKPRKKSKVFAPRGVLHKSTDDLLKLLVNHNIIRRSTRTSLEDFKGGYNLMDYEEKTLGSVHPAIPSHGQIR